MKKIKITISGGLGRMGSLLIKKTLQDKNLSLESVTEQKEIKKMESTSKKTQQNLLKIPMLLLILQDQRVRLKFLK